MIRRALVLIPFFLFVTGVAIAAAPVCDPSCYPSPTCAERLARFKSHGCPIPAVTTNDCSTQDREIGALRAQISARPVKCPPVNYATDCPDSTVTVKTFVQEPTTPKPVGAWLIGPTAGYVDGPFVGVSGGYQFAHGLTLLGSLTRHRLDGGGVWYTPPPCPHEKPEDPLVPYPGENVTGVGVTLLWRIGP